MPLLSRIKFFQNESETLALVVSRFGVGSMFLWFGIDKWSEPSAWYASLPDWAITAPVAPEALVVAVGLVEFAVGLALLSGRHVRVASTTAFFFLFGTALLNGVTADTVRDAAVLGCLLSLFIHANARARRPWGLEFVAFACTAYVLLLFLCGVAFLRNA